MQAGLHDAETRWDSEPEWCQLGQPQPQPQCLPAEPVVDDVVELHR